MKAKKSFGQHFLNNEDIAHEIAQGLLTEVSNERVLEIGPGQGMLTKYLIDRGFDLRVCLLYTSPSPRDQRGSRMPSSA